MSHRRGLLLFLSRFLFVFAEYSGHCLIAHFLLAARRLAQFLRRCFVSFQLFEAQILISVFFFSQARTVQ